MVTTYENTINRRVQGTTVALSQPSSKDLVITATPMECDEKISGHKSDAVCKHSQSVGPQTKRLADAIFYNNKFEESVDLIPVSYFHSEQIKRSMKNFRRNKIILKSLPENDQVDDSPPTPLELEVQDRKSVV